MVRCVVVKPREHKAHLYSLEREGRASHVRVRAYAYMRLLSPLQRKEATVETLSKPVTKNRPYA